MDLKFKKEKYDYLGAIGRMGNAAAPKYKKSAYSDINFGLPTVKVGSPLFDPYPKSDDRYYRQFMHLGPAQEKQLNKKQVGELIHELKEQKLRATKIKEDVKEVKKLSKKYMNSPWAAVPAQYRKKYASMDFDGDGIANKLDCYPFDYNRQATMAQVSKATKAGYTVSQYYGADMKGSAGTPAAAASKSTTTSAPKSTSSGGGAPAASTPVYHTNPTVGEINASGYGSASEWAAATGKDYWTGAPATSGSMTSTGASASGSGGSQNTAAPAVNLNNYSLTTAPYTPSYGFGVVSPGYNVDPSGKVVQTMYRGSSQGDQISYDSGKTWQLNTSYLASPGNPSPNRSSNPIQEYIADKYITVKSTWQDKIAAGGFDQAGWQKLYEDLLAGKINDPEFAKEIEKNFAPYKAEYEARAGNLSKQAERNAKMIAASGKRYEKMAGVFGTDFSQDWLNAKSRGRAAEILTARDTAFKTKLTNQLTDINKQWDAKTNELYTKAQENANAAAKAEAENKKGQFETQDEYATRTSTQTIRESELAKFRADNPNKTISQV